jgi:hypothetical protein
MFEGDQESIGSEEDVLFPLAPFGTGWCQKPQLAVRTQAAGRA